MFVVLVKNSPYLGQGLYRSVGLEDEGLDPLHPVGNGRCPLEFLEDGLDALGVHVVTAAGLTASRPGACFTASVCVDMTGLMARPRLLFVSFGRLQFLEIGLPILSGVLPIGTTS